MAQWELITPDSLAELDSSQNNKLSGVEAGATVGATVGTNFYKSGTTTNYATNEFQNADLSISAGSSGVFTLNRGVSSTTTTITKGNLGLNYTDGADVTANNTAADVTNVSGTASLTVKNGAVRANAGLDSSGNVQRTVPTNYYTNTTYSDLSQINTSQSTKLAGIAAGANNYSLPSTVMIGTPTISGTTLTIPRNGGGNVVLTTQDTNTHPSASETRGHFSGGGGTTYNSTTGEFSTDTTSTIRSGVISMVTEGSTTHSWSITGDNVFPSGSTQVTTFKWFAGNSSTPLKTATVTSTVDTSDRDLSSITWSGVSSGVSGTANYSNTEFQQVEASYNGLKGKVTCIVTDMEGWSFSKG